MAVLASVVVLDLVMAVRNPHKLSTKESASWAGVYIGAALVFGVIMFATQGATYGGQFYAGYLTELALSVDNLFVFLLIIQGFRVPAELQSRVLLVGIVLSIVLRGGFIAVGSVLIAKFSWVFLIFGAILIWTAIGQLRENAHEGEEGEEHYEQSRFMKFAESKLRVSADYHGSKLFARIDGVKFVTPLLLAMIAIGSTDILFALDSIPAIFGLTQEPYLVFTATIFALMGLRQLYFLLAAMLKSLKYLHLILGWIGVKLVMNGLAENQLPFINGGHHIEWMPHIPTTISLGIIAGVLAAVVLANWILLRRQGKSFKELFAESEAAMGAGAPEVAVAEK
jgi:tellurite resistance protein TerC